MGPIPAGYAADQDMMLLIGGRRADALVALEGVGAGLAPMGGMIDFVFNRLGPDLAIRQGIRRGLTTPQRLHDALPAKWRSRLNAAVTEATA